MYFQDISSAQRHLEAHDFELVMQPKQICYRCIDALQIYMVTLLQEGTTKTL